MRNEGGEWQAEINGLLHPAHESPAHALWVQRVWMEGNEVSEAVYDKLLAITEAAHPDHPARNPARPVDLMTLSPIIPTRTPK